MSPAVMYAAIGRLDEHWRLSQPGNVIVDNTGLDRWQFDSEGNHRYLIIPDDTESIDKTRQYIINTMMYEKD